MIGLSDLLINYQGTNFLSGRGLAQRSAYHATLTDDNVRAIRAEYDSRNETGITCKQIGEKYGKTDQAVSRIGRRISYQWVY